jgi:uncharacterized integral membrane protein (TIGR00697 family)
MNQLPRSYRYYDFVMAAFVCVLLCSNLIGAAKAAVVTLPLLGEVTFSAGVLFFPISYIFGDILTEVYGYGRDRRVVWAGFAALAFASFMAWVALSLPAAPGDFNQAYQQHMEGVFGNTWRIVAGSMIAFWCGSFANSYVMAKMKVWMEGRRCGCAPSARRWSARRWIPACSISSPSTASGPTNRWRRSRWRSTC